MVWINLFVLLGLVGFAVFLKNKNKTLEGELASLKEIQGSQTHTIERHSETLSAQKEVLDAQKELLAVYREKLEGVAESDTPAQTIIVEPAPSPVTAPDVTMEASQRERLAEEKAAFEKDLQKKKKTMDWYEKEFSIGLQALLDLFIHVPANQQKKIITKMPASVIKKGFKRLSDAL